MSRDVPGRAACLAAAALGGAVLVLAFPPFDLWPLGALAPVPLCAVAARREVRRSTAVLAGLAFGATFFAGAIYWVVPVMVTYGGLSGVVGVAGLSLLVAYLAVFTAVFAALVHRLSAARGPLFALAVAPVLWVALEFLRNYLFGGFPWVRLGLALHGVLPLLQLASVTGVYGLSFLLLSLAASLAAVVLDARRRGGWILAGSWLAVAAVIALAGAARAGALEKEEAGGLPVAGVQANVPQDLKWDAAAAGEIMERHEALTTRAVERGARLVVWPEASLPFALRSSPAFAARVRGLVVKAGVPLVLGSNDHRLDEGGEPASYNSGFLLGPDGAILGRYDKEHLVPFGEYVPLRRLFFFASPLVEAVSDLRPGAGAAPLTAKGLPIIGVRICYEIVFPELTRRSVRDGAELLVNLTNDAWYGESSAPHQHFAEAVVRAVENGRWLVRAANTGISGIVSPAGRVMARSRLNEATLVEGTVMPRRGHTWYVRLGDWFAWCCAILTIVALAFAGRGFTRA